MISVCIATHNGAKYIRQQIDSILPQLDRDDEILISDDGSTDNTINIIRSYNSLKINILPPPETTNDSESIVDSLFYEEFGIIRKVSNNFLNAISYAKGDSVYLCDQDDVWLPTKVGTCENLLKKYDVVIHRRTDVDVNLQHLHQGKENTAPTEDNRTAGFIQSLIVSHFQGACMCFTRKIKDEIIRNIDLFHTIPLAHDHAIGYIALVTCGKDRIKFEPSSQMLYRRHGNNVSTTGEKSRHSLKFKLLYRLNDLRFYLALRFRYVFK